MGVTLNSPSILHPTHDQLFRGVNTNSGEGAQYNRAAYQGQTERGGGRRTRIDIPHVEVPTAEDILKMRSQYSEQVKLGRIFISQFHKVTVENYRFEY